MKTTGFILILIFGTTSLCADSWIAKDTSWLMAGPQASNAFTIGNKAYILSNKSLITLPYNTLFEYDALLDTWTQKASYPERSNGGSVAVSIGTNAYVGLGVDTAGLSYNFYEYNSISNTWTQKANFPGIGAAIPFISSSSSEVIVGCGIDSMGVFSNEVWKYSPLNDSWTQLTNFPYYGLYNSAESYNGEIYIPHADTLSGTTELWKYNFTSNSWIQLSSCPKYMVINNTFTINDKMYVGLGMELTPTFYNSEFWEYNITTNSWQQVTSYPGLSNQNPVTFELNNFGYVVFGEHLGVPCPEVWQYIPDSATYLEESDLEKEFAIYPSVAQNSISIKTSSNEFYIIDVTGRIINIPISSGNIRNNYTLNISSLKTGIYFIIKERKSFKFIKI